jgi:hypothetical protein
MIGPIAIGAAIVLWYVAVVCLLISARREEKRVIARGKQWR